MCDLCLYSCCRLGVVICVDIDGVVGMVVFDVVIVVCMTVTVDICIDCSCC